VTQGHLRSIQKLIEHGCCVNLGDDSRKTALHYACKAGNTEAVKLLLESQGIDIHRKDTRGVRLWHIKNR
jgi:ankyrin repeat protein